MLISRKIWEISIVLEAFTYLHHNLLILALMSPSGINGMSLRCNMAMKTPSEKCFVSNAVSQQATARFVLLHCQIILYPDFSGFIYFFPLKAFTHFILPEYLMQKDQKLILEETVDTLKRAGVPEDEMAVLERQLAPPASGTTTKDGIREVGFVSAGVESQPGEPLMVEER
ncbi:hypothetical protein AMTR_s00060p00217030 [Amborella trichopoda]|uniref:Uncharacterized protein n=1 Tax=Amborella trichopoda TaxID=13333 RepID=W1NKC3_AMBTC|nr:hypothetical protein AMTR_s00060p00217030 [Amborella trichopoda]